MSSYFIFVLVLTVAYVIYYATMIALDLKKKPDEGKDNGEVIDVTEFEEEESIAVSENEGGFCIGENNYETTIAPVSVEEAQNIQEEKTQRTQNRISDLMSMLEESPKEFSNKMYAFDVEQELLKKQSSSIKNTVTLNFVSIEKKDPNEQTV